MASTVSAAVQFSQRDRVVVAEKYVCEEFAGAPDSLVDVHRRFEFIEAIVYSAILAKASETSPRDPIGCVDEVLVEISQMASVRAAQF